MCTVMWSPPQSRFLSPPKVSFYSFGVNIHPLFHSLANYSFSYSRMSGNYNPTVFFLLHRAFFTSEIHFKSCVSALHSFYRQAAFHCMYISHFLHSLVHRHVGCFQFLLIMNHLYIGHNAFIYLGKHLRRRITGPYGKCMFKKLPSSFLKCPYQQCHFASLPTMRVPITLHPPSSWYGLWRHFSHSSRSVVTGISHLLVTNVKHLSMCL